MAMADARDRVSLQDCSCATLIEACVRGDDRAKAVLYDRYHALVRTAAARELYRSADTVQVQPEDIVNEIFAQLFANGCNVLARLRNPQAIDAWLMTLTRNRVRSQRRAERSYERISDRASADAMPDAVAESPAEYTSRTERQLLLNECLASLEPQERLIVDLYYIQGLKYAEISDLLHLNINTVASKLKRGKEKLRQSYEERERDGV